LHEPGGNDDQSTLPELSVLGVEAARPPLSLALCVIWCDESPQHLGKVVVFPPGTEGVRVIGRGESPAAHRRARFIHQRPLGDLLAVPLEMPRLSREQLTVGLGDGDTLSIDRVGRCSLVHEGQEVNRVNLRPGSVIDVGRQLSLLCLWRPAWIEGPSQPLPGLLIPASPGEPDGAGLVGESPAMWGLRAQIAFAASNSGHVVIHGESGTGKELVARALHAASRFADRPMISRNAATIPDGIADAELFGNVRNYPNPGMPERPGLVGESDASTLFLDEIGELPEHVQARLLRVLDAGEYQRLGEARARRSSFRLVAATNRPLAALKHDVLARFQTRIEVPPLASRREDIPLLVRHIASQIAAERGGAPPSLDQATTRTLLDRTFVGNVRELAALVWAEVARGEGVVLGAPGESDGAISGSQPLDGRETLPGARGEPLATEGDSLTAARIRAVLERHQGVVSDSWRELGLSSRHALTRLIRKHGIELRRLPR
jgi:transcriptional regulator with AAA-type ATPase domain